MIHFLEGKDRETKIVQKHSRGENDNVQLDIQQLFFNKCLILDRFTLNVEISDRGTENNIRGGDRGKFTRSC